jgi:hypothetical protein
MFQVGEDKLDFFHGLPMELVSSIDTFNDEDKIEIIRAYYSLVRIVRCAYVFGSHSVNITYSNRNLLDLAVKIFTPNVQKCGWELIIKGNDFLIKPNGDAIEKYITSGYEIPSSNLSMKGDKFEHLCRISQAPTEISQYCIPKESLSNPIFSKSYNICYNQMGIFESYLSLLENVNEHRKGLKINVHEHGGRLDEILQAVDIFNKIHVNSIYQFKVTDKGKLKSVDLIITSEKSIN